MKCFTNTAAQLDNEYMTPSEFTTLSSYQSKQLDEYIRKLYGLILFSGDDITFKITPSFKAFYHPKFTQILTYELDFQVKGQKYLGPENPTDSQIQDPNNWEAINGMHHN